jgi:hypothetical protein
MLKTSERKYVATLGVLVISGSQLLDAAEVKYSHMRNWLETRLEAAKLAAEEEERNGEYYDDSKCEIRRYSPVVIHSFYFASNIVLAPLQRTLILATTISKRKNLDV